MGWIQIPRVRDAGALARSILSALRYGVHRRKTHGRGHVTHRRVQPNAGLTALAISAWRSCNSGRIPARRNSRAIRSETSGLRVCRGHRARPLARRTQTHFAAASGTAQPRQGAHRRNNTSRAHYRVDAAYIRAMGWGGKLEEVPRNLLTIEIYGALAGMSREERFRKSAEASHPPEVEDRAG